MVNKRIVKYIFMLFVCVSLSCLVAEARAEGEIEILSSFYPIYILTESLVKGVAGVRTSLMLPSTQGCPHEYMLTVGDMKKLSRADVFVVNGMGLERFTGKTVKKINERIHVITASQSVVPLYVDHNVNPHTWVSPLNAADMVEYVASVLGRIYPDKSIKFMKNAKEYAGRLRSSFYNLKQKISPIRNRQVFAYDNVFDYLFRDLGLNVVGVVEKHHGERASAGELRGIIRLIMKKRVKTVIYNPGSPRKVIDILVEETNIKAINIEPLASGESLQPEQYLRVMEQNIKLLSKALGR